MEVANVELTAVNYQASLIHCEWEGPKWVGLKGEELLEVWNEWVEPQGVEAQGVESPGWKIGLGLVNVELGKTNGQVI